MHPHKYLVAFLTLVRKEVRRFMRVWIQTIVPPIITTALYFLIFGDVIGGRIGQIQGIPYSQYIAPGLIMMSVINNSYANTSSSFYQAKMLRYIEELLIAPIPNFLMLLGFIVGGILRGVLVAIVVTATALFFTHLHVKSFLLVFLGILFSSTVFSLAGLLNAIYAKRFDDISIVPTFILTPLTYLGGVFYSVHLLSGVWQQISFFNPILYFVSLFRYGMLGISDVSVWASLSLMIGLSVILYSLCLFLLNKGVGTKA